MTMKLIKIHLIILLKLAHPGMAFSNSFINIATEEFPPISYSENNEIKGTATEKVKCFLKKANVEYEMKVYPWVRAYHLASSKPNFCVFATAKTEKRLNQFQWVSPLIINRSILVTSLSNPIKLASLDDARKYRIGIQQEDAGAARLQELGFQNLDPSTSIDITMGKLFSDRIDMVALAESVYIDLGKKGVKLKKLAKIMELEMGLACNKKIDRQLIREMQEALERFCSKPN